MDVGSVVDKNGSVSIHAAVIKIYFAVGRHGEVFDNDFDC